MKIHVGNLAETTTETDLSTAFGTYGKVERTRIVTDKDSGRPKGFGFVEMLDDTQANAAISGLNGSQLNASEIRVSEARPRPENAKSQG